MLPFVYYIIRFFVAFQLPQAYQEQSEINELIDEYELKGDCESIIDLYLTADSTTRILPSSRLKVTSCLLRQKESDLFEKEIQRLKLLRNTQYVSIAFHQEGLFFAQQGDTLQAIKSFKNAIETENNNTFAKYNYELLNAIYKNNKNQPPPPNAPKNDNRNENEGGILDENESGDDNLENSDPPEIDLTQALQLLDAMRQSEFDNILKIRTASKDSLDYGKW
ncbi:hypothetical protein [Jiulongibacter sp. NS-SX5]|uniref:hypothetical protein n=1 Tax=Jiulongibacter sp. NS-SX5 TaxID=3463854 RepID=UPI004058F987